MATFTDREHYIPIRPAELVDLLVAEKGPLPAQTLAADEVAPFRRFAGLMLRYYHQEYHAHLERLKEAYAPFDPDADTQSLRKGNTAETAIDFGIVFEEFDALLTKANYTRLTREAIEKIMGGATYWGIDMEVNWDVFERVEIYYRGDVRGWRTRRYMFKFWKKYTVKLPTFRRMVLILKQQPHKRLGKTADVKHIFVKLFKDIPQMDMEMVFPGTRIKMKLLDRGKLGASTTSSIGYLGWKLSSVSLAAVTGSIWAIYAPAALVLGYAYKTWSGFQSTKQTYMQQLTSSLYYQNLDNNAGVLYRLLSEAEEQEVREALLGYFYLWRYANDGGWSAEQLDDYIELELAKRLGIEVDFEIEDALGKLERLGLTTSENGKHRACGIEQAIRIIETRLTRLETFEPSPLPTTRGTNE